MTRNRSLQFRNTIDRSHGKVYDNVKNDCNQTDIQHKPTKKTKTQDTIYLLQQQYGSKYEYYIEINY